MQVFFLTFLVFIVSSCRDGLHVEETGTRLSSKDHSTTEDRINILKQQVKMPSEIKDAEFDLFNVNGFANSRNTIPGASSWDYKIAVKIDTADIKIWTGDLPRLTIDTALDWLDFVPEERKSDWVCKSRPSYFIHDNVILVVYHPEGIVFKRIIQD